MKRVGWLLVALVALLGCSAPAAPAPAAVEDDPDVEDASLEDAHAQADDAQAKDLQAGTDAGSQAADADATGPVADAQDEAVDLGPPTDVACGDCDDGTPCTMDSCVAGTCVHASVTGPCDDGDACSHDDFCGGGTCLPGASTGCDDGNPCTQDACDPATGACGHVPTFGGCSDGSVCTVGDHCLGGACVAGNGLNCGDGNDCTVDLCDDATGCSHVATAGPCSDGLGCTVGEACKAGVCTGGTAKACEDGNPCTNDSCSAATGACVHAISTSACDDANACTLGDTCGATGCAGKAISCDDGSACTTDTCVPKAGCAHASVPSLTPCDDGLTCTVQDLCVGGSCQGIKGVLCDDGKPCTWDLCTEKDGCLHPALPGPCDDGVACTIQDHCQDGACSGSPLACDDGNPCTQEKCVGGVCVSTPGAGSCDDGDPCTSGDACSQGACSGSPVVCAGGGPCAIATCVAGQGCVVKALADGTGCGGGGCAGGQSCQKGSCVAGQATGCDDGNPCTKDTCDAAGGCSSSAVEGPCDDGSACTQGDACIQGACKGAALACDDGSVCTVGSCQASTGKCVQIATLGTACSDGNPCTLGDACQGGACVADKALSCDDGNDCSQDLCLSGGCQHVAMPDGATCSDGNPCTLAEACSKGQCQPPKVVPCDDGNPCTTDACLNASGCVHLPATGPCSDGDCCTAGDKCVAGVCKASQGFTCDDGLACTLDSCLPVGGCSFQATGGTACHVCMDEGFEAEPLGWGTWAEEPKYLHWELSTSKVRTGLKAMHAEWHGPAPLPNKNTRGAEMPLRTVYLYPGQTWLTFDLAMKVGTKSCTGDDLTLYGNGQVLWKKCDDTVAGDGSSSLGTCTDFQHVTIDVSKFQGAPLDLMLRIEAGSEVLAYGYVDIDNLQIVGACETACAASDLEQHATGGKPGAPGLPILPMQWPLTSLDKSLAWSVTTSGGHTGVGALRATWKGPPSSGVAGQASLIVPMLAPLPGSTLILAERAVGLGTQACGEDDLEVRFAGQVIHTLCGDHPAWQVVQVDLTPYAGQVGDLEFRARGGVGLASAGTIEVDDFAVTGACSYRCFSETFATGKSAWVSTPATGSAAWQTQALDVTSAPLAIATDLASPSTDALAQLQTAEGHSIVVPAAGATLQFALHLLASQETCPEPLLIARAGVGLGPKVVSLPENNPLIVATCAPTSGWQTVEAAMPAASRGRLTLLKFQAVRSGSVAPAVRLDDLQMWCH